MKERSGCRSLLPALTRSPVSAACPMQTCFTSIADATENCKERSCFSFLTRASMKLIFILGTSGTRWPAFLSIKVWHYAANLAVSLSKGLLFPPDLSLTLFLTCQHVILAICLVSCHDSGGPAYLTHQGWHFDWWCQNCLCRLQSLTAHFQMSFWMKVIRFLIIYHTLPYR